MRTLLVGGLIGGAILFFLPGHISVLEALSGGALLTFLLLQLGPRSIVEKVGCAMTAALLGWAVGPPYIADEQLLLRYDDRLIWWIIFLRYCLIWSAAGAALAFYLHPKSE